MGRHLAAYSALPLAAWRGRRDEVSELIGVTRADSLARGGGLGLSVAHWAATVLNNGLGLYEDAMEEAAGVFESPHHSYWSLSEIVEAGVRAGRPEAARTAITRLEAMTSPTGSDWGLGVLARSRALLSDDLDAERLYREAIARLSRTRLRLELARAQLLYGEWLRRERRRVEARDQLRAAYEAFASMGAEAFADRATRELLATGETARKRSIETRDQLTASESQIAILARDGLSNPTIGAQLFISPRTVQYHLHKVFGKLGIASRSELDDALADDADAARQL
ncbi:MAG: LuxR C-terminal-related transcriptional regulator [Thermoleophilaceae bacterium]